MAFTTINLIHQFFTNEDTPAQGYLTAVLTEPITNAGVTISTAPKNFPLDAAGNLSVVLEATDNVGTTSGDGNPQYNFFLYLAGSSVQTITSAICSGAVDQIIDWDQLPLTNGEVPPAAVQTIVTLNGVGVTGTPTGAGDIVVSTSTTGAAWGSIAAAGIEQLAHKGQASGYAGLDTHSYLTPSEVPVFTSTPPGNAPGGSLQVIPSSALGAASGVAELDSTSLVPVTELGTGSASNSTFLRGDRTWQEVIQQSQVGADNGVAGLGSTGLVPTSELGTGTASASTFLRGDGTWVAAVPESAVGADNGVAELGSTGLVPPAELGTGSPTSSTFLRGDGTWAQAVQQAQVGADNGVAELGSTGLVPTVELGTGTASITTFLRGDQTWVAAVPESAVGAASGVAELGSNSLVPTAELGTGSAGASTFLRGDQAWVVPTPSVPESAVGADNGVAGLGSTGLVPTSQLGVGTASLSTFLRGDQSWQTVPSPVVLTPIAVQTNNYSATPGQLVPVNIATGSMTVTLPSAPVAESQIAIKIVEGTGSVAVLTSGTDAFDYQGGPTTKNLVLLGQALVAEYANGVWYVAEGFLPLDRTDLRYLQGTNNLSDLQSVATARTNLGLGTAAVSSISTSNPLAVGGTPADGTTGQVSDAGHVHLGVTSFATRSGVVSPQTGDYTAAEVGALPATDDLSAIAAANPTAANVGMNNHKFTNMLPGLATGDSATFGQIPTTLPPSGAASGDLGGTFPSPQVLSTHLSTPLPTTQGGTGNATGQPSGTASGDLAGTFPSPTVVTTHLSAPLPLAQGGTANATGQPSGVAAGDLTGTYPSPTVRAIQGQAWSTTAPAVGNVPAWSGTNWVPTVPTGGGGGSPLPTATQDDQLVEWSSTLAAYVATSPTGFNPRVVANSLASQGPTISIPDPQWAIDASGDVYWLDGTGTAGMSAGWVPAALGADLRVYPLAPYDDFLSERQFAGLPFVVKNITIGVTYTVPSPFVPPYTTVFYLTLTTTASVITLPAAVTPLAFTVAVYQGTTGGFTYSFVSGVTTVAQITTTSSANQVDVYDFVCYDGTNILGNLRQSVVV